MMVDQLEDEVVRDKPRTTAPRVSLMRLDMEELRVALGVGAEEQLVPDAVFLNQHQAVVELEGAVV